MTRWMEQSPMERARQSLDGLSVGDAFGERFFGPDEHVRARIADRVLPAAPWKTTDDTAMALSVVEILDSHERIDQDALAAAFGRRYLADPRRGYGGGAHEILEAIGLGAPWQPTAQAVFDGTGSMGNGGAMRVAPVGACFADDWDRAAAEAQASAAVTHAHAEGKAGAVAIAVATAWAASTAEPEEPDAMFRAVLEHVSAGPTRSGIERARSLDTADVGEAVAELGSGSRVLSEDTVPFVLWAVGRAPASFEEAMWLTVAGLGDRDTTCAMVGGIVALSSSEPIPPGWLEAREPLDG